MYKYAYSFLSERLKVSHWTLEVILSFLSLVLLVYQLLISEYYNFSCLKCGTRALGHDNYQRDHLSVCQNWQGLPINYMK